MVKKLAPWRKETVQDSGWTEHPLDLLHREVNELFDTYYRGAGRMGLYTADSTGLELSETDDEIRIEAELPGMDEKDIQVTIDEDTLTIRGEHREQKDAKKRSYHISEMSYGGYSRTIQLPAHVDQEKAQARFKRGVLTLTLPKTSKAREWGKRIPVVVE